MWGLLGIGDGGVRQVVVYVPLSDPGDYQGRRAQDFAAWVCADEAHDSYGHAMTTGSCLERRFTYVGDSAPE